MAHRILSGNCCVNFHNEIWSAIRRATMSALLSRPTPPSAQADPVQRAVFQ